MYRKSHLFNCKFEKTDEFAERVKGGLCADPFQIYPSASAFPLNER